MDLLTNTATTRGWGKPGTQKLKNATGGGISIPVAALVAPIFADLFNQLELVGIDLAGYADDWGYCFRPVRGYEHQYELTKSETYLSNHSWGLAVDLNSSRNPMTTDPRARREFKANIIDPILMRYRGRLIWGGEYSGARKDYMHFEFTGTPKDAAAIVDSLNYRKAVAKLATLDTDDLAAIDGIVKKYARLILGNTQADDDGTHVSLADLSRKIDSKA